MTASSSPLSAPSTRTVPWAVIDESEADETLSEADDSVSGAGHAVVAAAVSP